MILRQRVAAWGLAFRQGRAANLAQLGAILERRALHDTAAFFRRFAPAGAQRCDGMHFSGAPPQQLSVR